MKTKSTLKCPACGFEKEEEMSTNSCLPSYTCTKCGEEMKAQNDDCCVFCSHGSIKCPAKQEG